MRNIDLGYESEEVLAVPIRMGRGETFDADVFRETSERDASTRQVSVSAALPTQPVQSGTNNLRPEGSLDRARIPTFIYRVDTDQTS